MNLRWIPAGNDRLLAMALGTSIVLHAVLLAVHFKFPAALRWQASEPRMEVVLVNAKTRERPLNQTSHVTGACEINLYCLERGPPLVKLLGCSSKPIERPTTIMKAAVRRPSVIPQFYTSPKTPPTAFWGHSHSRG